MKFTSFSQSANIIKGTIMSWSVLGRGHTCEDKDKMAGTIKKYAVWSLLFEDFIIVNFPTH